MEVLYADAKGAKMLSKTEHALLMWDWKYTDPGSVIILNKGKLDSIPTPSSDSHNI